MRAVLLGERGDLDAALRSRYTRAGLAHVLAISGLHLGLLLSAVFFLCRILGMSPSRAAATCLAALPLFLGVTVVRAALAPAALMAAYFFTATAAGRRASPLNALALATLLLAARDPWVTLDLGFQLSTIATAAIIAVVRPASGARRGAELATGAVVSSWAAQLAVSPLVAITTHRIPLAGFWLNPLAVPLLGVVLASALVAGALETAGASPAAQLARRGAGAGIALLDKLATSGGRPSTAIVVPAMRDTRRGELRMVALDVGQGDAVLVETPASPAVLVDTGGAPASRFDPGSAIIAPALRARGLARLGAVAITHFHADHSGGLAGVLAEMRVHHVWTGSDSPRGLRSALPRESLLSALAYGHAQFAGPCSWTTLHPSGEWLRPSGTPTSNNASWVALLECSEARLLLTGDAEQEAESAWIRRVPRARRTVLKVPHHGSATSSTNSLLEATGARHAVISVGWNNRFGLPAPTVLERYRSRQIAVYRTDRDGAVTLTWSRRILVRGERWSSGCGTYRVGGW